MDELEQFLQLRRKLKNNGFDVAAYLFNGSNGWHVTVEKSSGSVQIKSSENKHSLLEALTLAATAVGQVAVYGFSSLPAPETIDAENSNRDSGSGDVPF